MWKENRIIWQIMFAAKSLSKFNYITLDHTSKLEKIHGKGNILGLTKG
jgi:hypothetical protein